MMNMDQLAKSQDTDAAKWTDAFIERVKNGLDPTDWGWMVGVFANAIEAGRSAGQKAAWLEGAKFAYSYATSANPERVPSYIRQRNPYGPEFPGTMPEGEQQDA